MVVGKDFELDSVQTQCNGKRQAILHQASPDTPSSKVPMDSHSQMTDVGEPGLRIRDDVTPAHDVAGVDGHDLRPGILDSTFQERATLFQRKPVNRGDVPFFVAYAVDRIPE